MASPLAFEIDKRSVERAKKILAKYQGRPLAEKLERGTLQAARMLVNPIRAVTPVGPTGDLRKSIRAASPKNKTVGFAGAFQPLAVLMGANNIGGGIFRSAYVGPSSRVAPHRHLIARGHRIVTPGGRDTGRRTAPFPFVDIGTRGKVEEARAIVSRILFGP